MLRPKAGVNRMLQRPGRRQYGQVVQKIDGVWVRSEYVQHSCSEFLLLRSSVSAPKYQYQICHSPLNLVLAVGIIMRIVL